MVCISFFTTDLFKIPQETPFVISRCKGMNFFSCNACSILMVILKLGDLATFINGNCRKSATFKSNKSRENLEDTFEKRRLFLTSLVTLSVPKADEWESSYKSIAVAFWYRLLILSVPTVLSTLLNSINMRW